MNVDKIVENPELLGRYHAYGLTIEVAQTPPRLVRVSDDDTSLPVRLAFKSVPDSLEDAEVSDELFEASNTAFLCRSPLWRMVVWNGCEAQFQLLRPISKELEWYVAVTNAVAIAGYQRGFLPLHASGILSPRGVIAVIGHSGAGKTTTVTGLAKRGYALFADDLCLIEPRAHGYLVGRGAAEVRLIADAVSALEMDVATSIGFQPARNKFSFEQPVASCVEAPLAAIVELNFDDGPPRLDRLSNAEPLSAIMRSLRIQMPFQMFPKSQRMPAFELLSGIARNIPVYRLTRPKNFDAFDAGLDLLTNVFGE